MNPERVRLATNPFRVSIFIFIVYPGLSLALQPWAEISQRLRRYFSRLGSGLLLRRDDLGCGFCAVLAVGGAELFQHIRDVEAEGLQLL